MNGSFDPLHHAYTIDGEPVPSVTQVLGDLLPGYQASEWHMQRGTAMHACAAMVAQGVAFDHDPQLDGRVMALRAFFRAVPLKVAAVEQRLYSPTYRYAGTCDLVGELNGRRVVLDWKSTLTGAAKYQVAAYGQILGINYGLAVEIREDGFYRMSEVWNLARAKAQWLALLSSYNIRRECGIKEGTEVHE
jgi:hypothetical protein